MRLPAVQTEVQTVVVLGASPKPWRYAFQTVRLLKDHGHRVIPVHPRAGYVDGVPAVAALAEIGEAVDTLTLYLGPERARAQVGSILRLRPRRVILNPGTESRHLELALDDACIPWEHACTLVLLRTGQF